MEPIKTILIDDERSSLENLEQKIREFCPELKILATVEQPKEALLLIRHHKPDVIFLDIEMPHLNGFRMLDELGNYSSEIVFTTAYNHYAVEAIRISAFDYLMKPVSIVDLKATVSRLSTQLAKSTQQRLDVLRQSLNNTANPDQKIAVPTWEGLEFILIRNVVRIESSSNYSRLFFVNGESLLVTRQLKEFEEMLTPFRFCRVHNIHLINLQYVKKYIRGEGGSVIMENGDEIDVSRRKKDDFLRQI
ncbi:MAG TPA: LytTR family DNA-binding domain-containing protein [Puia sp.]|uniref:LytR/AlgR family response regulator transcription factor n=1 Tax=Puia sp. TaxID=2045100 RepID=UPI002C8D62E2|nr:LytTR family DNA-binding domain-containing protein [Puia sp.]HVU97647.1 LytTR family DNA-binding domain-containing protein [Puia sp.]